MEDYKRQFISFLLQTEALNVFEKSSDDRTLKSKRISPWFVNIGDFDDGETSATLGRFYADAISNAECKFDLLYGIPDKGREIVVATANEMARKGNNVPRFSTRRVPKDHGEASSVSYGSARTIKEFIEASKNISQSDRMKAWVVGRAPKNGQAIVQLDDVFTAGDAKYEALDMLKFLGDFNLPLLAIAVDRQEVAIDSREAIAEYQEKTGIRVVSIVNAVDVYNVLKEGKLAPERALERMANYLRVYGTAAARRQLGKSLEQRIIEADRSVIPACDVSLETFERLVGETADVPGIGAYKIPAISGRKGWETWVSTAKKYTNKPLIYDHQKAGNDIVDPTPKDMVRNLKESGFDAVIVFAHSGPESERSWIFQCLDQGLKVIAGGWMTHPAYTVSEGGFITDQGAIDMYRIAARAGVNHFVVPGNKPDVIQKVREIIEAEGVSPTFYAPGFVAQGGKIGEATKVAGNCWHAIVGRGIYETLDFRKAAMEHTSQLIEQKQ